MEHTISNIETYISLLLSLLKFFDVFEINLIYHEHNEDVDKASAIQRSNCHRNTGLNLKDKQLKK